MSTTTLKWQFVNSFQLRRVCAGLGLVSLFLFSVSLQKADGRFLQPFDNNVDTKLAPSSDKSTARQSESSESRIDSLMAQFDAVDFGQREKAQLELAAIGESAISPLAYKSFDCSPEAQWRIKKTLEEICTNGSEGVFYQALGVLKVRFEGGSTGNATLNASLEKLKREWQQKRKQATIAKLRKLGATVDDPLEGAENAINNIQVFGGGNMIWVNGGVVEIQTGIKTNRSKGQVAKSSQLSEKEIKQQIAKILAASVDENRDWIFGTNSDDEASRLDSADNHVAAQFAIRNQIRANQLIVGGNPISHGTGVSITIDKKWTGQTQDLKLVRELENVQSLAFSGQTISKESVANFQDIFTLTKLAFADCRLEDGALKQGNWPSLSELEFENFDVDASLIKSCASLRFLQMLTFNACEMKPAALANLKDLKNLRGLQFMETEVDKSIFKSLTTLKQITYLNLSVCKFETADYQMLKSARPSLQIAYRAQAFFGVRGPTNMGQIARPVFDDQGKPMANAMTVPEQCLISDVIPDSGAHRAGIKIGDVIEKVNGQKIGSFDDLKLHIAQHRVGDKLDVSINRSGKKVELVVELASQKTAPRF